MRAGAGVMAAVGKCGSGKTYGLMQRARQLHARGWRILVLDTQREWNSADALRGVPRRVVRSVDGARRAIEEGHRFVLLWSEDVQWDAPNPWGLVADSLARVAIDVRGCVLVLPEAHKCMVEGYPLSSAIKRLLHEWRHVACGVLFDTQSPADVKKEAFAACEPPLGGIRWYATGSTRDLAAADRIGGKAFVEACKRLAAHAARDGRPGWHMRVSSGICEPPFVAVRSNGTALQCVTLMDDEKAPAKARGGFR